MVDSKDEPEAHRLFDELGVTVDTGLCFLGSFIIVLKLSYHC